MSKLQHLLCSRQLHRALVNIRAARRSLDKAAKHGDPTKRQIEDVYQQIALLDPEMKRLRDSLRKAQEQHDPKTVEDWA